MYTSGIRKIYTPPLTSEGLVMAKHWADNSGYESFCFNGDIYVKTEGGRVGRAWIKTPFRMADFTVTL